MRPVAVALRAPFLQAAAALGATGALVAGASRAPNITLYTVVAVIAIFALATFRGLLSWHSLVAQLIVIILVVPIRRFTLPGHLPFQLEPYRLFVAFLAFGWLVSLLVDFRVRLRRTGFDGPILLFAFAIVGSVLANTGRIAELDVQATVTKKLTFFASFFIISFLITSVIRTRSQVDVLVRTLVAGGAILGIFGVIERRTGYNMFNDLHRIIPVLRAEPSGYGLAHGYTNRAYASAEHPIAFGAALALILPLGIYLAQRPRAWRWRFALGAIVLGVGASGSRTAITMMGAILLVYLWLRPRETRRIWPAIVPALIVLHLALPGQLGNLKSAFFPKGGIVAQQNQTAVTRGSGRIAVIGPSLAEFAQRPVLGEGSGTRVTDLPHPNARLLDDQWLGTLLETGIVGALALLWIFVRVLRRLGAAARADTGERGWLYTAVAASIAGFPVGMFTFDAFSFTQVTILLFIILGLASALLHDRAPSYLAAAPRLAPRESKLRPGARVATGSR